MQHPVNGRLIAGGMGSLAAQPDPWKAAPRRTGPTQITFARGRLLGRAGACPCPATRPGQARSWKSWK